MSAADVLATAASVAMQMSPLPAVLRMRRAAATAAADMNAAAHGVVSATAASAASASASAAAAHLVEPAPLFLMACSAFTWLVYGLLRPAITVAVANFFGLLLASFYCLSYVLVASGRAASSAPSRPSSSSSPPPPSSLMSSSAAGGAGDGAGAPSRLGTTARMYLALCVAVGAVCATLVVLVPHEAAVEALGWTGVVVVLVMMASPLAALRRAIATRNKDLLPGLMALAISVQSALWVWVGVQRADAFIYVPNAIGTLLGLVQLVARTCIGIRRNGGGSGGSGGNGSGGDDAALGSSPSSSSSSGGGGGGGGGSGASAGV